VLYLWLIILLIGDDVSVDSDTLLVTVTDFVNLKIKSTQSFRGGYMGRICVYVFIQMSIHIYIYISICICIVFLITYVQTIVY
jgi:hypothetical protein